jgi:hypothetical protein
MSNIYKQALRQNIRFEFKGLRSTEELWDLSVEQLDSIFQTLNAQRKTKSEESLLSTQNEETAELDLKLEIIRDIVGTLLQEKAAREEAANKAIRKQKVLEAIARKKDDELGNLSVNELEELARQL